MTEKGMYPFPRGYITVYITDNGTSHVTEVYFEFEGFMEMRGIHELVKRNDNYSFFRPALARAVELTSDRGADGGECPHHGISHLRPNKKGGNHSHYCSKKTKNGWCGHKVYR